MNSPNFGNKNLGKWVEDSSDFNSYLTEIKYRESLNMEDEDAANIHGTGETDT